jgi:ABC-type branched-subunit amino acid transport system permease subunit
MTQFLSYVLPGIPFGCAYALMAVGLVLTYRASGVFNLAFGAQAYVSAVVFYVTVHDGWPKWAAFVVAVVVFGPLVGLALDYLLFRYTRTAPPLVKLVPALGLLIAIPSVTQMIIGPAPRRSPPALVLSPNHVYFHLASLGVTGEEIATTSITVGVVVVLVLVLRSGTIGLRMRAVVESPRLTELAGIRAERVSAFAWMLSSLLAGLAGVLLAAVYTDLSASNFTALLVAAIAAGAVGGFASLPLTLVGGVALGIAQEVIGGYLPSGTVLSSGVRPAFPFVVLAVFLVARRTLHQPATASDPLAAVDPPAPSLRPPPRMREVATGTRAFTALIAVMFVVVTLALVPGNWEFTLTQGLVLSIVFLSITLLTGMGGMISLCQAAFAGVGAFTAGQLAMHFNVPVMIGTVAGGLLAAAVGALVSLPTLRLGGVTLALLTLSFALVADNVLFVYSWAGNGASGVIVPRPTIVGLSFAGNAAFFWLALVVLAIAATAVRLLRDGTVGEELTAFRGSETASSAIGIDVRRLRITAFTLSAATAGIGGAMYGSLQGSVSPNDFNYQFSLVFMVVVATVGVYTVAGAIEAGVAYTVLQQLIANLPSRYGSLLAVLFGAAAITYVRHPEGAVAFAERWVLDRAEQLARRLKGDEPVGGQGGGRVHDDPSAVGARAGRA